MRKRLLSVFALFIGLTMLIPMPVSAATKGSPCRCPGDPENQVDWTGVVTVDTAILSGCNCTKDQDGNPVDGGEVIYILKTIVDIMTIGIGILGVIGISITGVQYLTAGGSEEKTRKAKRRMLEIVIGLAAYVLIYSVLKWLGVFK